MSSVVGTGEIESLLQRIGEIGALPDAYAADPGSLFLAIHDQWVENGGTVAGKRRNSIQTLSDLLKTSGMPVASLRQKLNGDTRLKSNDAIALLNIYFSCWSFVSQDDRDGSRYRPLEDTDSEQVRQLILEALFARQKAVLLPKNENDERRRVKNVELNLDDSALFLASRDVTVHNFKLSKSFIHVSRIVSVAGPTTAKAIRAFSEIMDEYWRIDRNDQRDRTLIWVVDPGDRDVTRDESLPAIANSEQLATFFRAVCLSSDPHARERWSWLSRHAVVLVGSMEVDVTDRLYETHSDKLTTTAMRATVMPRGIKYSHFLLDTPPPSLLLSPQFAQLYGHDFKELENSSFLLCLDDAEIRWSYFGYAQTETPIVAKDGTQSFSKFLEFDSPGPVFDQVASIVHAAACFRLGLDNPNISEEEQLRSMLVLRHLDFAVFRLSEFLNAETLSRAPP